MKIQATYEYKAPPEKVFSALTDPAVLQKCIEGCEQMEKTGEDCYDAKLRIGVAGVKGNYTGKVRITDKKPPESFVLQADGNGAPGWVKGTAKIQISPRGEGSELQCDADGQVGGLIAAVGSRLVEAAGKKMMQDFLRKLGELLGA
jgi:carbon monoxide dehydrogenase subunit G